MISAAAGDARNTIGPGNVHRVTDPVQAGDALDHVRLEHGVGQVWLGAVRADEGRGDGVDRDAVLAPLDARHLPRWAMAALLVQ